MAGGRAGVEGVCSFCGVDVTREQQPPPAPTLKCSKCPASGPPETARLARFDCSIDKHDCQQHVGSLGSDHEDLARAIDVHAIQKQTHARLPEVKGCDPVNGTPNRLRHLTTQHRLKTFSQQNWSFRVGAPHDRYTPRLPSLDWFPTASMRHDPRRPSSRRRLVRARWSCARMLPPRGPMPATSKCTVRAHSASSKRARGDRTPPRLPCLSPTRRPRALGATRATSVFARSASARSAHRRLLLGEKAPRGLGALPRGR